eukprot:3412668-Rhodomonas_salina.2
MIEAMLAKTTMLTPIETRPCSGKSVTIQLHNERRSGWLRHCRVTTYNTIAQRKEVGLAAALPRGCGRIPRRPQARDRFHRATGLDASPALGGLGTRVCRLPLILRLIPPLVP